MNRIRTLGVAATVAALAVAAAGCGSGGDGGTTSAASAANEWADGVCSAITDWQSALRSTGSDLKDGGTSKQAVEDAADEMSKATDTLAEDLDSLGKPDLPSGQKAKETVDDLSTQLRSDVDKIQGAIDDASGISGVLDAVSVVSATLVTMGDEISSSFDTLRNLDAQGELHDAFAQSDACKGLSNSSGG